MQETHGIESLDSLFEKQYLSHEIGMRKPDKAVFEWVVKENGLLPGETLFIDDSRQHVHGAREAGLKALWLNVAQNTIHSLFNDEGMLKGVVRKMTAG
ncbi:MAG: HAD-IA family hydrolase [Bacteroidales bacterium]|nr:HAD-IA family hydrolase [Bacteroidales bacterium]